MGILKSGFCLLLEEKKRGNLKGKKILQLGRQHIFFTLTEALQIMQQAGFAVSSPTVATLSSRPDLAKHNFIDDVTLFSLLGFEEVHSIDISSYENATFLHDLNHPIPSLLYQQYDAIFDGGTLEHIFSLPQVLRNVHQLLKEGGVIIHASPSHNYVDHGFYMFSPTIFSDYYSANKYKILTSYIFESGFEYSGKWRVYEYQPGCLEMLSFGGFGKKMLGTWFVAQKMADSTEGVIPQQGAYHARWALPTIPKKHNPLFIKEWLKKSILLRRLVMRIRKKISQFKAKRFHLKKIGNF